MRLTATGICLTDEAAADLLEAVHSREPALGLTHGFYRYPARFSPRLVRAAIEALTEPGDLVLDPFVGGGATLVEARVLGRPAIGVDINELAVFVSRVKTTVLSEGDLCAVHSWVQGLGERLNLRRPPIRAHKWISRGYQRNISGKNTWPIRKTLELALADLGRLQSSQQRRFARCILLKTAQWGLDCRKTVPSAADFRQKLHANVDFMCEEARNFGARAREADGFHASTAPFRTLCMHRSVIGLDKDPAVANTVPPTLILTSPPYPGVHVLYHRWQVDGRRETPAPFWIANSDDSRGASFYTLGDRGQKELRSYYQQMRDALGSLARLAGETTLLVQVIGFSDPAWQLPRYLQVAAEAGFSELEVPALANCSDGRLWRRIPNRKWYASQRGPIPSSREVVLFHRLR